MYIRRRKYDVISDQIAESLENKKLWRRAATRWLDVMQSGIHEVQREWIKKRRNYCLSQARFARSENQTIQA